MPEAVVGWGLGDVGQTIDTCNYKMNKFWRFSVQHGDYSSQYCIIYLEVAESRS